MATELKLPDVGDNIEKGTVVWTGSNSELLADASVKERYLHV